MTLDENCFDRWVTEKNLNFISYSLFTHLLVILSVEGRGVVTSGTDALVYISHGMLIQSADTNRVAGANYGSRPDVEATGPGPDVEATGPLRTYSTVHH